MIIKNEVKFCFSDDSLTFNILTIPSLQPQLNDSMSHASANFQFGLEGYESGKRALNLIKESKHKQREVELHRSYLKAQVL